MTFGESVKFWLAKEAAELATTLIVTAIFLAVVAAYFFFQEWKKSK